MHDRQYFIEATLRYEDLLESGQPISLDQFVAGEPQATRAELRAFLEYNLTLGELDQPVVLTTEQEARADAVIARARAAWASGEGSAQVLNLTGLRNRRKLTVGRLSRQLRLPVDLLARIERGKVTAASIPMRLVHELANLLQESVDLVQAALAAPPTQVAGARLKAADGTVESEEPEVTFAQAFAESAPTAEQQAAWGSEIP